MRSFFSWTILALTFASLSYGQRVSETSRCGADYGGLTCAGSKFGDCCSQYNYCGSTSNYCGSGCQTNYGFCSSSSSVPAIAVSKMPPVEERTDIPARTRSLEIVAVNTDTAVRVAHIVGKGAMPSLDPVPQ
jgi:hypothetical protein